LISLYLIIFCITIAAGYFLTPFFIDLFSKGHVLEKNFRGEYVPQGIGIIFALCSLPWYIIYILLSKSEVLISLDILAVLMAVFTVSLAGFIDDMLGTRDTLGFKGHFRALFLGKLTTGALKAIVGFLAAFTVSLFLSPNVKELAVNILVIALSTNLLNLLDLRPGRAIKFYIFSLSVLGLGEALAGSFVNLTFFIPLVGIVLGYFPFDLKARCMMGDAGSNVLGITVGILAAVHFNFYGKIVLLVILLMIHLFAEKYSLSDVIEHNKLLRYIDRLGRGQG
jgi:UDP-GlcNAc:undecaprenyl-phosphate GlcNAc-1-phosphate transferase